MQEKIEFFKMDSGKISIEYNAISGRLIIINGNRQILCQRDDPKFDIFKLFEVSSEDIQHIRALLDQTSIQNTEISLQLMAKVENKRQMYDLKLHTLCTSTISILYLKVYWIKIKTLCKIRNGDKPL